MKTLKELINEVKEETERAKSVLDNEVKEDVDLDEGKLRNRRIIDKFMNSDRSDPNLKRDADKAFEMGFNRDVKNYRKRTGVENYRRRLANSYEPEGEQINEVKDFYVTEAIKPRVSQDKDGNFVVLNHKEEVMAKFKTREAARQHLQQYEFPYSADSEK